MVLHKINGEKGNGPLAKKKFKVIQYPTFILLNADLEPINRWSGWSGKAHFSQKLTREMADPTTIKEKLARYQARPSGNMALSLADYHESRLEFADALTMVKDAMEMVPKQKTELLLRVLKLQNKMISNGKEGASIDDLTITLDAVLAQPAIKGDQRANILIRGAWQYFDKSRTKQAFRLLKILEEMDKTALSEKGQKTYDLGQIYQSWAKDLERFTKAPFKVSASVLKSYTGDYGPFNLKLQNGQLSYSTRNKPAANLIPMSKNMFCVEGNPIFRIELEVDERGNPTKIIGHYPSGYKEENLRDNAGGD